MTSVSAPRVDLTRFKEQGYLVVDDVLDGPTDLDPVVDEYATLLDEVAAHWHAAGHLAATYAELPFGERLAQILRERGPEGYQPFDISLPFSGVTEQTPIHH